MSDCDMQHLVNKSLVSINRWKYRLIKIILSLTTVWAAKSGKRSKTRLQSETNSYRSLLRNYLGHSYLW